MASKVRILFPRCVVRLMLIMSDVHVSHDVFADILKYLDGIDLCNVSQTCRTFCNAVYIDGIWQYICKRDYGVVSLEGWQPRSFRELYIQVLHKYGYLLGLWKRDLDPYGGLVYIKVGAGQLVAEECRPPFDPDILAPLRPRPLFAITVTDGKVEAKCLTAWNAPHHHSVIETSGKGRDAQSFAFTCGNQSSHDIPTDLAGARDVESLRHWMVEEYNNGNLLFIRPHLIQLVLTKYTTMHSMYRRPIRFSSLQLTASHSDAELVLQPGVFKGTYSSHGIELVLVTVTQEKIVGTKLTGDPNVPFDQLTFDVDLSRPILEQESSDSESLRPGEQPFQLDQTFEARFTNFPSTCKARYPGRGQIASHGFLSPQWTPGQFILFNEDLFGFLWLNLMAFSVFSRTTEPYLKYH